MPTRSKMRLRSNSANPRPVRSSRMSDRMLKFWFTYENRVPGRNCKVRVPPITRAASSSPNADSAGAPCSIATAQ